MVSPTAAVICFHRIVRPKLAGNWLQSCANTPPESHQNLLEPGPPLHQGVPEPSPKPSPEPGWTWPALHQHLPKHSPTPSRTLSWPTPLRNLLRNLFRNVVEPASPAPSGTSLILASLSTNAFQNLLWNLDEPEPSRNLLEPDLAPAPEPGTFPGTFSRTFSGTFPKLLRNLLRNLVELDFFRTKASRNRDLVKLDFFRTKASRNLLEPSPSAHGSYSGLKAPLAYAVGQKSQNALARGRQLCTQLSIIEGSLAELLRFWCCQLGKLRKSRRIATFLMLKLKHKDVSQKSFVFKLADRQTDRQTDRQIDR